MSTLKKYESFLEAVKLDMYREMYQGIKIVEMDLPKNIQVLDLIYETYWKEKNFIHYEKFYDLYKEKYKVDLELFRNKTQMCETCFYLGLPARTYRTWVSIITQIQAGYLAENFFGAGTVSMSTELDRQGADFQVNINNTILNFQVKKESYSREVRKEKKTKKSVEGLLININYSVPDWKILVNPKKRNGEFRKPYLDFQKKKTLRQLSNRFIIFTEEIFKTADVEKYLQQK